MMTSSFKNKDICSVCKRPIPATYRHCLTCGADAGVPNVRRCRAEENIKPLRLRFNNAQKQASENGRLKPFKTLENLIKEKSGVVITMSARRARALFESNEIYSNYGKLVGAEARKPADFDNDRHRCAVGGILFGSYDDRIIYGLLSLTSDGLPTYGDVHCRLRSVAVKRRTSFLESNSYKFVDDHNIHAGSKLPDGYMADWNARHILVLAKIGSHISMEHAESDWQKILVKSDGKCRENDEFVEAHIYGSFDKHAIESVVPVNDKKLNRNERLDIDIIKEQFKKLKEQLE